MTLKYADAKRLADVYVDIIGRGKGITIAVTPLPYGWIFYYNSRDLIETGDRRKAWAGNAPFLVTRVDGNLRVLGTCNPGRSLAEFEQTVPPAVMAMEPEPPPPGDLRVTPCPAR